MKVGEITSVGSGLCCKGAAFTEHDVDIVRVDCVVLVDGLRALLLLGGGCRELLQQAHRSVHPLRLGGYPAPVPPIKPPFNTEQC